MSALTDRITEVLEQHRPYGLDCKCGEAINSDAWWAAHVAERIAAPFTEELVDLRQFLQKAEECVYANVGPSPVLVEIRAAQQWANSWITAEVNP